MTYSAVIFDLDGTLLDSMPFYAIGWQRAFDALCGVDIGPHAAYEHEGAQAEQFVQDIAAAHLGKVLEPDAVQSVYLEQRRIFESVFEPRFFPGAENVVALPRALGISTGLVSGSKRSEIVLKTRSNPAFLNAFDVIVSGDETVRGKPAPDPFLRACEMLGCEPPSVLVIENAPLGLRSAVAAGTECWIVLNSSPLQRAWAEELGATAVLTDLAELQAALAGSLRKS